MDEASAEIPLLARISPTGGMQVAGVDCEVGELFLGVLIETLFLLSWVAVRENQLSST